MRTIYHFASLFSAVALLFASGSARADCSLVRNIDAVTKANTQVLFIGEWHGTTELPTATVDITCQLLEMGKRVNVALELPVDWNRDLGEFIRASSEAASPRLSLSRRWNATRLAMPDGRTSEEMWNAIEKLRSLSLKHVGQLDVFAFDTRDWEPQFRGEYSIADLGMATSFVQNLEARPADITVVLTGELHARGKADTVEYKPRPMAYAVKIARPALKTLSIKAASEGGEYWGCIVECKVQRHKSRDETLQQPLGIEIDKSSDVEGFDGRLRFRRFTASPPYDPIVRKVIADPVKVQR